MAAASDVGAVSGKSELGVLADPQRPVERVDVAGCDVAWLQRAFRDMTLIRVAEEAIGALVEDGLARAPCHLGIGQEAGLTLVPEPKPNRKPVLRFGLAPSSVWCPA